MAPSSGRSTYAKLLNGRGPRRVFWKKINLRTEYMGQDGKTRIFNRGIAALGGQIIDSTWSNTDMF